MEASIPRNDRAFWADSIGGSSFDLDGERYTDQATVARGIVSAGDKVLVCPTVDGRGRRQMLILDSKGSSGRRRLTYTPFKITVDLTLWLQSNANAGQNSLGGIIASSLYRMDPDTTNSWNLPTTDNPAVISAGVQPYGLARFKAAQDSGPSPADCYASAWQYVTEADPAVHGWRIGTWGVSDRLPLWAVDFGTVTDDGLVNPDPFKSFRFFADSLSGWIHAFPDSTLAMPARILSARSASNYYTSSISRGAGSNNLSNVSLQSFVVSVEGTDTVESYFCCPATPETSGSGLASVDFLKMDQTTGEWESFSSYDSALIPEGGPSEIPDCLEFGSALGGPVVWRDKEAVVFASGGVRDLFDSAVWTKAHWTARSLKTDGTEGGLLKSKTIDATDSPRLLDYANLKSQALAATYTDTYDGSYWTTGIELNSVETDSAWAKFQNLCPILLPTDASNNTRMTTLRDCLAVMSDGERRWPTNLRNLGGGIIVDDSKTVWFTLLEPEQVLFGGSFSTRITGEEVDTRRWVWFISSECSGFSNSGEGWVLGTNPDHPLDGGEPFPDERFLDEPCGVNEFDATLYVHTYWGWDLTEYTRPRKINVFNQEPGYIWRTKLYGITLAGALIEADISQLKDVSHYVIGPVVISTTEIDLPIADNVWQIVSFADKNLVVILRDLHADGLTNNPSPCVEVWRVAPGDPVKLSTVRLGSYDELKSTDDFAHDNWKAGDQEWDPYAFGPPRMKACRGEDNMPVILVMVGENKKVNIDSESQFKRVCWASIEVANPVAPTVTRAARTSPDEGVGNSGNIDGSYPLWSDWDTLVLTPDHVAWIRDSQFQETTPP